MVNTQYHFPKKRIFLYGKIFCSFWFKDTLKAFDDFKNKQKIV